MNQRVALAIAAVVAVAAAWLTTRPDEPAEVAEPAPSHVAPLANPPDPIDGVPDPSVIAGGTPSVGATATLELTVGAPLQPIAVSPGFEFLSTPDMQDTDGRYLQWRRHQLLQSEPRDPSWAPRMEAALRNGIEDALTAQGFDTQRIELPVVECRSTGCEIQAVGHIGDSMKNGADLQFILPPLISELGSEVDPDSTSTLMSTRADNRRAIFVQLVRKKN